jgi:hypothetical protein
VKSQFFRKIQRAGASTPGIATKSSNKPINKGNLEQRKQLLLIAVTGADQKWARVCQISCPDGILA